MSFRCIWEVFSKLMFFSVFMQAMIRGELEVLKDWCYEAVRPFSHTYSELELL